jgi:iron-sulfur cluster assembly accessory protein
LRVEVDPSQDAALNLTDNFAKRMASISDKEGQPKLLRLRVEPGGCDGFSYKWYICDPSEIDADEDRIFTHNGSACVVDEMSLDLVKGATIDFVTELIGSEFKVTNNPNAAVKCSCGSSFAPAM